MSRRAATERCAHGFLKSVAHKICPDCSLVAQPVKRYLPADLTGMTFGKLHVIGVSKNSVKGGDLLDCVCSCGRPLEVARKTLRKAWQLGHVSACPKCRSYTSRSSQEVA